jgi:hypothetical protein
MYFSGCMKVIIATNKAMFIETCIRPSLDQMFAIKDLELKHLKQSGKVIWRIVERKKKLNSYEGIGVNDLHDFKWARIK